MVIVTSVVRRPTKRRSYFEKLDRKMLRLTLISAALDEYVAPVRSTISNGLVRERFRRPAARAAWKSGTHVDGHFGQARRSQIGCRHCFLADIPHLPHPAPMPQPGIARHPGNSGGCTLDLSWFNAFDFKQHFIAAKRTRRKGVVVVRIGWLADGRQALRFHPRA